MREIKDITTMQHFLYRFDELRKISQRLHTQDENACNQELSKAQQTRVRNLEARAQEIAQEFYLNAMHQTDPRGISLYLTDSTCRDYSEGIAVIP